MDSHFSADLHLVNALQGVHLKEIDSFREVKVLEIGCETARLRCAPSIGASILSFSTLLHGTWTTITRTLPKKITSSSDTASFVMAPYPNRIADSKFQFNGHSYTLDNGKEHAIHGYVRNREWEIVKVCPTYAIFRFDSRDFADIDYPFPFQCVLKYEVQDHKLMTSLELSNVGTSPMPAGCGFHPYFKRALAGQDENIRIQFQADGIYRYSGGTPLPSGPPESLRPEESFLISRPLDLSFDHCFSGWHREAVMYWPKSGVKAAMAASSSLGHLVLYSPVGKDYFALEPQSQVTNGFNLFEKPNDHSKVIVLEKNEKLLASFTIRVENE